MKNTAIFSLVFCLLFSLSLSAQNIDFTGSVKREDNRPLSGVRVQLLDETGEGEITFTDEEGNFFFQDIAPDLYSIALQKEDEDEDDEGITMFDLLLILRHILNEETLSFYQQLAADINSSGSITTFDTVLLRKVLLQGEILSFPSWRFIPVNVDFDNPTNSLLIEDMELSVDLRSHIIPAHFIGVQAGNVRDL